MCCLQVALEYVEMLKQVYPTLVLDPYVVTVDPDAYPRLHMLRMASKRFVVYQPANVADSDTRAPQAGRWEKGLSRLWGQVCEEFGNSRYQNLKPSSSKGILDKACNLMVSYRITGLWSSVPANVLVFVLERIWFS